MSFVEDSNKYTNEMSGRTLNSEHFEENKKEDKAVNDVSNNKSNNNISYSRSRNIAANIKTIINLRAKEAERKAHFNFEWRSAIANTKHYLQCFCASFTFTLSALLFNVMYHLVHYVSNKQSISVMSLVELTCCVWLLTLVYVIMKSVKNVPGTVQTSCQERERSHICSILQKYEQRCESEYNINTSQNVTENNIEIKSKTHLEEEEKENMEKRQTRWWGVYSRCAAFVNSESLRLTLAITSSNSSSIAKFSNSGLRMSKAACEPMMEYCHKSTLQRATHYLDVAKCKVCTLHNTIHNCKFIDVLCYLLGICVDECTLACQHKEIVQEQKVKETSTDNSNKAQHTGKYNSERLPSEEEQEISKNYTVAEAMEFFVSKMSSFIWFTAFGLLMINFGIHALLQYVKREASISTSENRKVSSADCYFSRYCVLCLFALLGLIPCVSVIAHRLLTLYYNIYLDKLCHYLFAKSHHDCLHDVLPEFTRRSSLKAVMHILIESNINNRMSNNKNNIFSRCGSRIARAWITCAQKLHLLSELNATSASQIPFSLLHHSLMDGLGTMTVLALLNQRGLISDTVPVPARLLLILPQSLCSSTHAHGQVHKHTDRNNKRSTQTSLSSSITSDSSHTEHPQTENSATAAAGSVLNTRSSSGLVCTSARNENTNNTSYTNSNNTEECITEAENKANEFAINNTQAKTIKVEKESHHVKSKPPLQKDQLIDLPLARSSSNDDNVIDFVNEMDSSVYQGHLHPLALCALMHATTPMPSSSSSLLSPSLHNQPEQLGSNNNRKLLVSMRLCDYGWRWGRAIHWLPRLCGFQDRAARNFTQCVRIVEIVKNKEDEVEYNETIHKTKQTKQSKASNNTTKNIVNETEQVITLIMEQTVNGRATGALHLFIMGTPCLVLQKCNSYWAGKEVVAFHESTVTDCTDIERNKIANLSCQTWQRTMGVEPVAFAHGVIYTNTSLVQTKHDTPIECSDNSVSNDDEFKNKTNSFASMLRNYVHNAGRQYAEIYIFNGEILYNSLHSQEFNNNYYCNTNKGHAFDVVSIVAHCPLTFLGVIGLQDSVHLNVQPAMSALDEAGIRCMYFCRESDALTKSLGSRVGLPTDWNCCISLDEQDVPSNPLHNRAQMPFGVHAIRHHIMHVDAIPLQVNLFCHASEVAQRAMLNILQDNHEIIMAVGSAIDERNVMSFTQAQLAMAVLPSRKGATTQKEAVCRQHVLLTYLRQKEKYYELVQRQDRRQNKKSRRGSSSSSSSNSSRSSSSRSSSHTTTTSTSTSTSCNSDSDSSTFNSKHRSQKRRNHHRHNHHNNQHHGHGHHHHHYHHHHHHHNRKETHKKKHVKVKHNKTSRSSSSDSHSSLPDNNNNNKSNTIATTTLSNLYEKKNQKKELHQQRREEEEVKRKYEELMQSEREIDCWEDVIEPCDFAALTHLTILAEQEQQKLEQHRKELNNMEEQEEEEKNDNKNTLTETDTTNSIQKKSEYSSTHGLIQLIQEYKLIAEIVGSSCALRAPASSHLLPVIVTLIEQARRRVRKRDNCVSFIIDAGIFISAVQLVWLILCYTPICTSHTRSKDHYNYNNTLFSPITVLFELLVIIPLLSVVCALSSSSLMSLEVMKTIPTKHNYNIRWSICKHRAKVWCARYVPSLIVLLVLVYTAQGEIINIAQNSQHKSTYMINNISKSNDSYNNNQKISIATDENVISIHILPHSLILHGYVLLLFNLWLLFHAITHINRHECISLSMWTIAISSDYTRDITRINLWRWKRWQVISATVMCATFCYISVSFFVPLLPHITSVQTFLQSCKVIMNAWLTLFTFSPVHLIVMCVFPFCLLYMDRPIKRWRCRRYSDMQKFRKLTFGTKLGMHSPCGDYEPESTSQSLSSTTSSSHIYGEAALYDDESEVNNSVATKNATLPWRKRLHEALFHETTMYNGALELNCVCCDHVDGLCAAYHVDL